MTYEMIKRLSLGALVDLAARAIGQERELLVNAVLSRVPVWDGQDLNDLQRQRLKQLCDEAEMPRPQSLEVA